MTFFTDSLVEKIVDAVRGDHRLTLDKLLVIYSQMSKCLLHETITERLGTWNPPNS